MKTFLDITDINLENQLKVQIELIEHDNPDYTFKLNNIPFKSDMYFSLLDEFHFDCEVNKGIVEIKKITIDGKEIMPIYLHLADPKTNWITANWTFKISGPFYPWYHEITGQGWIA